MRFPLILLLLTPFAGQGQIGTGQTLVQKVPDKVISFSLGHAFDNVYEQQIGRGGYLRGAMSLMKQTNSFQYGLTIEGGTNSNDHWYLSPGLIANLRIPCGNIYYYAGGMAGYILSGDMTPTFKNRNIQGYVLGVQSGVTLPLSWHWQFNAEVACRSAQIWEWDRFVYEKYIPHFTMYIPVTVGLRYQW